MDVRVLWFGRPTADPFGDEVATYQRRITRRWPCRDVPLKPHRSGRDDDPRRALAKEAETLERSIPDGWYLVALDERGRHCTSEKVAAHIERSERDGRPGVAFVIGSDLGLDPAVRNRADLVLALSALTLPHLLARLLVWEQIFRSVHILSGGRYHRQGVQ